MAIGPHGRHQFNFVLPAITLWAVPTSGHVLSVPITADVDADGYPDVSWGTMTARCTVFPEKRHCPLGIPRGQQRAVTAVPSGPKRRTGSPIFWRGQPMEPSTRSMGKTVGCFGNSLPVQRSPFNGVMKDVTGDGVPEAFFGSEDEFLYGVKWPGWPGSLEIPGARADSRLFSVDPRRQEDRLLAGDQSGWLHCLIPARPVLYWCGRFRWANRCGFPRC